MVTSLQFMSSKNACYDAQGRIQTVANDLHKSLNFFIDNANMEQNIEKLLIIDFIVINFSL